MKNFLHDAQGDLSSKRLMGIISLGLGIIGNVWLFFYGMKHPIGDIEAVKYATQSLLYTGGALLGIGVVENVGAMKYHK